MKKMISRFADALLSREDLKRVKGGYGGGGTNCYNCSMHFHSGGYEHTKQSNVHTSSLQEAEQNNSMCDVNGTSCYTCCTPC